MRALRWTAAVFFLVPAVAGAQTGAAQQPKALPAPSQEESTMLRGVKFLGGAAAGFAAHEAGHLLFSALFDAGPGVKGVTFGPMPFFAITHTGVPPGQEFVISSGGFLVQEGLSEIILTRRPRLRGARADFAKGVLAFNIVSAVAYAGSAFARAGPPERDTRSMAATSRVDERWVGVMILVPAVLDAYRYFHPDARWAAWASRGVKIGSVLLVVR